MEHNGIIIKSRMIFMLYKKGKYYGYQAVAGFGSEGERI